MTDLDQINVNTIRFLAVDAVEQANSGQLITAHALGDYQALVARDRRVLRGNSGVNPAAGLALLKEVVDA